MFDKTSETDSSGHVPARRARVGPEDERIALRCHRKELQLLDTFVASGEFRSRSDLMRAALHDFLRRRADPNAPEAAPKEVAGLLEVPVRLRPEEVENFSAYGQLAANGAPLGDVVAQLARRGELEMKVADIVQRQRLSVRQGVENRAQLGALQRTSEDLERRGVVGR